MRTLLRDSWIILRRDRFALALTFLLPIAFFSIFASIFAGSQGSSKVQPLQVLVADFDRSRLSNGLIDSLAARSEIAIIRADATPASADQALAADAEQPAADNQRPKITDASSAKAAVRAGTYDAALVIPAEFGDSFPDFAGAGPAIQLFYDSANPIAQPSIVGLLQAAAFQAAPDALLDEGLDMLEASGLNFDEEQTKVIESARQALRGIGDDGGENAEPGSPESADRESEEQGNNLQTESNGQFDIGSIVRVEASPARAVDDEAEVAKKKKQRNQMIAYYAAGIGVMFLLFSTTGAAGSLLDERESGTLDRLLCSNLSMGQLLTSRWLFYSLMGALQLIAMFVWGKFMFGLDLLTANHLAGFAVMATLTATAAAAFGMLLATLSRTRAQMNGIATILVLVMSAVGGSMIPRFVMPASFQRLGKFTFNGWAIDGFLKVFWYDDPSDSVWQSVGSLWAEALVLTLMTVGFLFIARQFARRWEAV